MVFSNAKKPNFGLPEISRVGFRYKAFDYTPDRPCSFDQYCTPKDALNWQRHTEQWIAALYRRANTPERQETIRRLFERYGRFVESASGCRFTCTSPTEGLVSAAQLAKAYADSWGEPIDDVENDWGNVGPAQTPIPPEIHDLSDSIPEISTSDLESWWEKIQQAAQGHWVHRFGPWIALGVLLLMANQRRGR